MKLAETLQDPLRALQLEDLHFELESRIKAMELNKNVLENALRHELQVIQQQREELNRKEKELIDKTFQEVASPSLTTPKRGYGLKGGDP